MAARILCVEDEEDLRKDIVEELRDAGYSMLEAGNGKAALEVIAKGKPDLILCDISMPGMGGYELLEEIRANHPEHCDVPFIFLTALADRSHIMMGKKLGADDYLTKPVDYELLLATVEARLEHAARLKLHHKEQLIKVYKAAADELAQPAFAPAATGAKQPSGSKGVDASPVGDESAPADQNGDVALRLQNLVTDTPTKLVAGRIQLVGLSEIKAVLGERWVHRSEVIYALIEKILENRLARADVYQRDGVGNFTICFATLNEAEAAFKARAIAEEIRTRILGRDFGPESAPLSTEDHAFLDALDGGRGSGHALAVKAEAHEIELHADEVEGSQDLIGLLTSRLEAAAAQAKKSEHAALIELVEFARLELHRFETQQGQLTPFQFATFDTDTKGRVEALRSIRPGAQDLLRDIDVLLLTKVAEEILRRPPGKNVVLIVNIHFSTIDSKQRLEHFKRLCDTLSDAARAALIFNVMEIPHGLLPAKVAEYFHAVRHYCRAMTAECALPNLGNLDPQMLRTPILSYNAVDFAKALQRDPGQVSGFLKRLRLNKTRLLVYGVNGERQRATIRAAGVDFLSSA
ncbi:MAG: response regulator [Kiloniellaceae bacterium]